VANHLLQRIYGTLIQAAPDAVHARAAVDRAESSLGWDEVCPFRFRTRKSNPPGAP